MVPLPWEALISLIVSVAGHVRASVSPVLSCSQKGQDAPAGITPAGCCLLGLDDLHGDPNNATSQLCLLVAPFPPCHAQGSSCRVTTDGRGGCCLFVFVIVFVLPSWCLDPHRDSGQSEPGAHRPPGSQWALQPTLSTLERYTAWSLDSTGPSGMLRAVGRRQERGCYS